MIILLIVMSYSPSKHIIRSSVKPSTVRYLFCIDRTQVYFVAAYCMMNLSDYQFHFRLYIWYYELKVLLLLLLSHTAYLPHTISLIFYKLVYDILYYTECPYILLYEECNFNLLLERKISHHPTNHTLLFHFVIKVLIQIMSLRQELNE